MTEDRSLKTEDGKQKTEDGRQKNNLTMEKLISIIIPCKDEKDNIDGLLRDIESQKISFDTEVIKITGISPSGKARNIGARKAKGNILVFIDCDISLGSDLVLDNLIRPLIEDRNIGAVCASVRIPLNSSKFQVRYTKEIPHCESPLVDRLTEVGVTTSQCCAIGRDLFFKLGGFNENIIRGVDPEFSYRLRKAGYRTLLVPYTWCYHPQPDNIIQLVKIQFRDGKGVAFVDIFYPHLNIDVHPEGIIYFSERKSIFRRIIRFLLSGFEAILRGKILLSLAKVIYVIGYCYGIVRYRILRFSNQETIG